MKSKLVILTIVMLAGFAACNKPVKGRNGVTYKNAVQYNDYIVSRQVSLMKKMVDFSKVVEIDLDSAAQMLDRFVKETDVVLTELKGMPPYKQDSAFRDAGINSFIFYRRVFAEDYPRMLNVSNKPDITPEEVEKETTEIMEKLSDDEGRLDKAFQKAQKNFASKNKMKLRENSMQKEIEEGLKD